MINTNSNLPVKRNESFLNKIKSFFRKVFYKKGKHEKLSYQADTISKNRETQKFGDSIKAEVNNDFLNDLKREEFLDKISKNFNIINDLSIEKLEKIEQYYIESIKYHEKKLASLKNEN